MSHWKGTEIRIFIRPGWYIWMSLWVILYIFEFIFNILCFQYFYRIIFFFLSGFHYIVIFLLAWIFAILTNIFTGPTSLFFSIFNNAFIINIFKSVLGKCINCGRAGENVGRHLTDLTSRKKILMLSLILAFKIICGLMYIKIDWYFFQDVFTNIFYSIILWRFLILTV